MRKLLCLIITILLIFSLTACDKTESSRVNSEAINTITLTDTIKCNYYTEKDFRASIQQANSVRPVDKNVKGGIIPHHLLAGGMISSFFKAVSQNKYDLVLIIAPNHKRAGMCKLNTAREDWSTPFGVLSSAGELTEGFVKKGIAQNSVELLEEEHSISSIVPYIKYYFPDSKICPFIIHGNYSLKESVDLGNSLKALISGKNCLVIASVDFSHYLTAEKADKMDEITLKAIKEMDIEKISKMTNDNIDSPPSMITFLTIMNSIGSKQMDVLGHDNSARITKNYKSSSTTSYFTMTYK